MPFFGINVNGFVNNSNDFSQFQLQLSIIIKNSSAGRRI